MNNKQYTNRGKRRFVKSEMSFSLGADGLFLVTIKNRTNTFSDYRNGVGTNLIRAATALPSDKHITVVSGR